MQWLLWIAIGLVALGVGYYVVIGRISVGTMYDEAVVVPVIGGDTVEWKTVAGCDTSALIYQKPCIQKRMSSATDLRQVIGTANEQKGRW